MKLNGYNKIDAKWMKRFSTLLKLSRFSVYKKIMSLRYQWVAWPVTDTEFRDWPLTHNRTPR